MTEPEGTFEPKEEFVKALADLCSQRAAADLALKDDVPPITSEEFTLLSALLKSGLRRKTKTSRGATERALDLHAVNLRSRPSPPDSIS